MLNFGGVGLSSSWFVCPGSKKQKLDHKKEAGDATVYAFQANKPFAHEQKKRESFEIALFQNVEFENVKVTALKKHLPNKITD